MWTVLNICLYSERMECHLVVLLVFGCVRWRWFVLRPRGFDLSVDHLVSPCENRKCGCDIKIEEQGAISPLDEENQSEDGYLYSESLSWSLFMRNTRKKKREVAIDHESRFVRRAPKAGLGCLHKTSGKQARPLPSLSLLSWEDHDEGSQPNHEIPQPRLRCIITGTS